MTTIKDLEMRIEGAEDAITFVKDQLAGLKTHLQELKEQEEDKQPESLFGRWATHPEHGRGIIISDKPDGDGDVRFAYRNSSYTDDVDTRFVLPESLDLYPVTLTTIEEFKSAPIGTIIECTNGDAFAKDKEGLWNDEFNDKNMNNYYAPARVIRWGNGQ